MNGVAANVWSVNGAAAAPEKSSSLADVVEVVLSWGDGRARNVLGVVEVKAGGTLEVGDDAALVVPSSALGCERAQIVRYPGDRAVAIVPTGATLRVDGWPRHEDQVEIACGHVVEILVGAFTLRITRGEPGTRTAPANLGSLRSAGTAWILGSALLHAAAFAAVALFCPSLGATQEDSFDYDRLALMQKMLDAHATPEIEETPSPGPQGAASGGDVNAGQTAQGKDPGAAGRTDTAKQDGRWTAKGDATPENSSLAREHALALAATLGLSSMLPAADPNAPVVPWGTVQNGSDDTNTIGHMFGTTIGDAIGAGGLDLSGVGETGSGDSPFIGLDGIGTLGHTGKCVGDGPCTGGIGVSKGIVPGTYHAKTMVGPRYANPEVSGRLPPEIIQRIVRANDGRYRFCYQSGLKTNPDLAGRVTVKFIIDRSGAVAVATDGGSDIPDAGVRQCVISSFTSLSFPAPDNGMVTVVYPLVFSPQ
jgi:hypothetical protein